jgi:hypothetical protein
VFGSNVAGAGPNVQIPRKCLKELAGTTRLELATSAVTGQRSNQLNYVPTRQINEMRNTQCLCSFARFASRHCLRRRTRIAHIPVRTAHKPPVRNHGKFHNQSYRNSFPENAKALSTWSQVRRRNILPQSRSPWPIKKKSNLRHHFHAAYSTVHKLSWQLILVCAALSRIPLDLEKGKTRWLTRISRRRFWRNLPRKNPSACIRHRLVPAAARQCLQILPPVFRVVRLF